MTVHSAYFLASVLAFVLILTSVGLYFFSRARRISRSSWESLVKRLVWISPDKAAEIALDLLTQRSGSEQQSKHEPLNTALISEMVGGLKGLEILKNNSEVLIDLAAHLQQWYPEALPVAEELRLNARELERHVDRLRGAAKTGDLKI